MIEYSPWPMHFKDIVSYTDGSTDTAHIDPNDMTRSMLINEVRRIRFFEALDQCIRHEKIDDPDTVTITIRRDDAEFFAAGPVGWNNPDHAKYESAAEAIEDACRAALEEE